MHTNCIPTSLNMVTEKVESIETSHLFKTPPPLGRTLTYLWSHLLPHSCKHGCSVDVLLVPDVRDVYQNGGLAMDEPIQDVFLESWEVVGHLLAPPHAEGVVAVREEDGLQLGLVVQQVALVDVGQLDLVLLPFTAQNDFEKRGGSWYEMCSPLGSAPVNEVVVNVCEVVDEGKGTCSRASGGGNEVFQSCLWPQILLEVLVLHLQPTCMERYIDMT